MGAVLTYLLAVLAACANAVSSVLQRKANKRVPQRENMSLRQIWLLLQQPVWFGGILAITAGFLTQTALNAGQLIAAQPGLTLSDPLISVLWGVLAFHEQVRQGWYILGEVACAGAIAGGVILLARSPLLSEDGSADDNQPEDSSPRSRLKLP
jgi:hypothetical protein